MAIYITILLAFPIVRHILNLYKELNDYNSAGIIASLLLMSAYILGLIFLWNL